MTPLQAIGIAYLIAFVVIAAAVWFAPEGYETDEGFFYGPHPDDEGRD